MPGLQFRPGIRVRFSTVRGRDGLVSPADVLKGTWCFHILLFGGELWVLEHYSFIGLLACFFFFPSMPVSEARFAKAAVTVYSCRRGKNNFAHLERMPSSK